MLQRLFIKNYAIIDSLELELGEGFNVFTGETGAGKSIIVGALSLLLGERGDLSSIRTGEEKAIVEGEIHIKSPEVRKKLKEMQLDHPDSLLIRRELAPANKSRVFINGLQEPINKLEEVGEWLVDIHGQHDHQLLLNQKVHMDILDSYGKLEKEREKVGEIYSKLMKKIDEKKILEQDEKKLEEEKLFWENAVKEIKGALLQEGEEEELAEELKRMENAEKINQSFASAKNLLYEDELAVSSRLTRSLTFLKDVSELDKRYSELIDILEDALAKVNESVNLISDYQGELDFDEKTMEETIDRMELIKDYKRKYRKNSIRELNQYAEECERNLSRFENRLQELEKIEKEIEDLKQSFITYSMNLSKKRQEIAGLLSNRVKAELAFLGMDKAEFVVDFKYVKEEDSPIIINNIPIKATPSGIDRVEFFISSNPGEEPKPLKKVASGGEISRIMLALKSIFAQSDLVETLVFDEIDVGIGGLTANNVAQKMQDIAKEKQVVVITHLSQIAAKAHHHFYISKYVKDGKTFTRVEKIKGEKRIEEITRMLGGDTEKSRAHAKEMLGM